MREGADSSILTGANGYTPSLSAWLGSDLLAAQVPITSGTLSVDVGQQVPERLTFTVPEWAFDGTAMRAWVPDDASDPLNKNGQYVDAAIEVTSALTGEVFETRIGRYQIQDWRHDDLAGLVYVECVGLLQRPADARFRVPVVPRSSGTFASEFARLMVDGIPVIIDSALTDRAVPQSFQWNEDRLGALYDLADAWPARIRMDEFGSCNVLAPLASVPAPVLTLTDGSRGTLISAPRQDTRDNTFNVWVVRSSATDDPASSPVIGVAAVTAGPLNASGPYGEVVGFYSSPLLTTSVQCQAAAVTKLADSIRPARVRSVTCVPDPRIELDDALQLIRGDDTDAGWVVGYDLPLTINDGPMTIRVGVPS